LRGHSGVRNIHGACVECARQRDNFRNYKDPLHDKYVEHGNYDVPVRRDVSRTTQLEKDIKEVWDE